MRAENRRHIAEGSERVGGTGQQSQVRGGWGREPLRRHKRNRPVWILCLIWGVTFAGAGASAVGELHTTDKRVEIRVKLYQGYIIVVQGSIGKLQKLNFVIDTGAVPSVVDSRVAQKLGLNGTSNSLSVFSRNVPTEELVVPNIELGAIRAVSVRVLSQDLSFIEKALGVRIDALIGLDVLGQSNLHYRLLIEANRLWNSDECARHPCWGGPSLCCFRERALVRGGTDPGSGPVLSPSARYELERPGPIQGPSAGPASSTAHDRCND
jgi:predicted aspartyl protease